MKFANILSIVLAFAILGSAFTWTNVQKETRIIEAKFNNIHGVHMVTDLECPKGSALTFIQYWNEPVFSNKYKYKYHCASDDAVSKTQISTLHTQWKGHVLSNKDKGTQYLAEHNLNCPESSVLVGMFLEFKVTGGITSNYRYKYKCAHAELKNCKTGLKTNETKAHDYQNVRGLTNQIIKVGQNQFLTSMQMRANVRFPSTFYDYSYGRCEVKQKSEIQQLQQDTTIDKDAMERHHTARRFRRRR